jgi:hypothetical protein
MGRPATIELQKLASLRASGNTVAQMAEAFGVSVTAVKKALAKLTNKLPQAVLVETKRVDRAAEITLDAAEECVRIRRLAEDVLTACTSGEAKDYPTAVQAIGRLQKSLDQWIKMVELLHDWRSQHEFQEEVLAVVGEVHPIAREEIVRRLQQKRSLRLSLGGAGTSFAGGPS